jgi:hypothetical protein
MTTTQRDTRTGQDAVPHRMGHFGCTEREGWAIEMCTVDTIPVFANNGDVEEKR